MIIYQEKITPPLVSLTDDEQMKLIVESAVNEESWVTSFIDRLADAIRDVRKH